jgi:Kef-type K+ transport system membrane component KefB
MLPIEDPVLQFTVLVLAALVAQLTVERLHLPGLLGLLVLGMLLGPGGFQVMTREPVVDFLGPIGLIYVMFLAGLEIDLDVAREHAREAVGFGLLAFICSLVPAAAVAFFLLGFDPRGALLLGALISSHTLLAYPIVERLGLLRRVSVVTAIGGTLVTDTLALVLLAVVISTTEPGAAGWVTPLGLLALISAAALVGVPRLSRFIFRRATISRAEKALYVLVVLLVLASATEITGTEEVLGAFLAGIALNRSLSERDELREHLEFVGRMLFIPFFFVYTGMLLALDQLLQPGIFLLSGLLLLLVVGGKAAAAWIIGASYGYTLRDRLLIVGLTTPQAAATLAITITASQAGLLGAEIVDAVVVLILATCLLGPVLTMRVGERISAGHRRAGQRQTDPGEEEPVRREV